MSRTFKDRQKRYYRIHKHATYRRGLSMWADDFSKRKDRQLSQQLRTKLKKKDKKEIKEYEEGFNRDVGNLQTRRDRLDGLCDDER